MTGMDPRRARVFGSIAQDYDRYRPGYPDDAVRWLVPDGAELVADLGAGTDKLTGVLARLGVPVVAIEPDPDMLSVLTSRFPAVPAVQAPAEVLPLADGSVDAVLVAQAWHWFDHARAVSEVRRVLRPGGWLALVGNAAGPREPWLDELTALDPEAGRTDVMDDDQGHPWFTQGLTEFAYVSRLFPWTETLGPVAVRARLATWSIFAIMEPAERDDLLDRMQAVVQAEADRLGTPTVTFTFVAHCARVTFPG